MPPKSFLLQEKPNPGAVLLVKAIFEQVKWKVCLYIYIYMCVCVCVCGVCVCVCVCVCECVVCVVCVCVYGCIYLYLMILCCVFYFLGLINNSFFFFQFLLFFRKGTDGQCPQSYCSRRLLRERANKSFFFPFNFILFF